jgi:hypothetical protein
MGGCFGLPGPPRQAAIGYLQDAVSPLIGPIEQVNTILAVVTPKRKCFQHRPSEAHIAAGIILDRRAQNQGRKAADDPAQERPQFGMPPLLPPRDIAGGHDHIVLAELFDHFRNLVGRVRKITIHPKDDLAPGLLKAFLQGAGKPPPAYSPVQSNPGILLNPFRNHLPGSIRRIVVHHDDFTVLGKIPKDLPNQGSDIPVFIIGWQYDRNATHQSMNLEL